MYSGLCPKCGTYNGSHMEDSNIREADAVPKRRRFCLTVVLAALLVIIPLTGTVSYLIWEKQKVRELLSGGIGQVSIQDGNTLIFSDELFDAPVKVTVTGADIIENGELSKVGKVLVAVKAETFSEHYSFDARVSRVALKYECGGNVFYQQALDSYYMEDFLPELGLTEEELLPTYGVGNGDGREGYWFFCMDAGAENPELMLMAGEGSGGDIIFQEGMIPLDFSVHTELSEKEVST